MKVAIFGASGLVGRSLRVFLEEKRIPWVGTYNTSPFEGGVHLDSSDIESLKLFFQTYKITHCINCVAERNVDLCEKQEETTMKTNCWFASRVAEICYTQEIYFLHVSTDYVFDGSSPPYLPESPHCAIQAYGRSKSLAETEIQRVSKKACIVRVPVLYTQRYRTILETAVTMIGKKVMDSTKVTFEDDYFPRRPVYIDDFSLFLINCLLSKKEGTYHFYNTNDKVTKYTMAKMIGSYLGKSVDHIHPQSKPTSQAGRPYDTQLMDIQYDRKEYPDTSLKEGIEACFQRYKHPLLERTASPSQPIFYMIDLDGTLVDTDELHYKSYKKAFAEFGFQLCDWNTYERLPSIEQYCREVLGEYYTVVKESKQKSLLEEKTIDFIPGAESFLQWLIQTKQNVVIVTNTTKQTVNFFQEKLPLLQGIHQWITREDVTYPKPNEEPYRLAKQKYWKGEMYCLGFENTVSGYLSVSLITPIVYIVTKNNSHVYTSLYKHDLYFIPDFKSL